MSYIKGFVTVLVLALSFTVAAEEGKSNDELYEEGLRAFNNQDIVTSLRILRKPAAAGHPKSQLLLGYIYDISEYDDLAIELYNKAAAQDVADAHFWLGTHYFFGEALKKDPEAGLQHMRKAEELGSIRVLNFFAEAYKKGDAGLPKDAAKAKEYEEKYRQRQEEERKQAEERAKQRKAEQNQ